MASVETGRASTRWPWLRSVSYALACALSPAVWVLQTQSCSHPERGPTERTGIDLLTEADVEPTSAVVLAAIVALAFAAPFFAQQGLRPLARALFHVAGLLSAFVCAAFVLALVTFTLFEQRVVRPAGYLVVLFTSLPMVESIVRIVLTIIEERATHAKARGERPESEAPEPQPRSHDPT